MSEQHTPGPWGFSYVRQVGNAWDSYAISTPAGDITVRTNPGQGCQRHIANARLIAAAPELLAALEALLGWHEAFPLTQGEAELPVVQRARAAITKARGEAP